MFNLITVLVTAQGLSIRSTSKGVGSLPIVPNCDFAITLPILTLAAEEQLTSVTKSVQNCCNYRTSVSKHNITVDGHPCIHLVGYIFVLMEGSGYVVFTKSDSRKNGLLLSK